MPSLLEVAGRYELPVIEDAAESLGSTLGGRHTGTLGCRRRSFNGNKIVTTGGGGAILTNDAALAQARPPSHHDRQAATCVAVHP